ncbi:MAG TPA: glycosyltransferase family 9 protein, partial [Candidatus Ozemobacteraceae bacterium]|nr:glycosyltransferase family 9 protein [Candidatus Ozemobacteraceae bacterium]
VHLVSGLRDLVPLAHRLRRDGVSARSTYDLQGKVLSHLLCLLMGGSAGRYTKRSLSESWHAWRGRYPLPSANPDPVWRRYLATVQADTVEQPDARLIITDNYLRECREFLTALDPALASSYVAFHPGASHPGKRFTPENLQALVSQLHGTLLFIGDQPDPPAPQMRSAQIIDGRGRIPLRLLPGTLRLSQGLIGTDSGPMHLARATGTPLVACFFQTDPCLGFAPIPGNLQYLISRPLPCKPCSLHGQRTVCPVGTWACRHIDWVAEAAAFKSLLYKS